MDLQWKSPLSKKIWQKMQIDAKHNQKTPLGIVSLMINLEHQPDYIETKQNDGPSFE